MEKNGSIRAINERLARKIRREGKDPKSPYANRFVGIANGKVVVIADSLTELLRQLRKIEPDGSKCYGVDVAADYSRVEEV
jgi:hypothetical protein